MIEIAQILSDYGIQNVIVKDINEASQVKDLFKTILVLYGISNKPIPSNISITINKIDDIKLMPKNTNVELKIDTGMHRNGILPNQILDAIERITKYNLILKGVFTHFACANENNNKIFKQKKLFDKVKEEILSSKLTIQPRFHCSNTAGTMRRSQCPGQNRS